MTLLALFMFRVCQRALHRVSAFAERIADHDRRRACRGCSIRVGEGDRVAPGRRIGCESADGAKGVYTPAVRHACAATLLMSAIAAGACTQPLAAPDAGPADATSTDALRDAAMADESPPLDVESGPPTSCMPPPDTDASDNTCVLRVRGMVVDTQGAPVGGILITVCGYSCFYGSTATDGTFEVDPAMYIPVGHYAIEVHARPNHASVFVALPTPVNGVVSMPVPIIAPLYTDVGPAIPDPHGPAERSPPGTSRSPFQPARCCNRPSRTPISACSARSCAWRAWTRNTPPRLP